MEIVWIRVSGLANGLSETSKEILEIIKQKGVATALYTTSNVTREQKNIVRLSVNHREVGAGPKTEMSRIEAPKTEGPRSEIPGTGAPRTDMSEQEVPKTEASKIVSEPIGRPEVREKKLTVVFRP